VRGNITHIAEIKQINRELNVEHREWMICIGRGFGLAAHAQSGAHHRPLQPRPRRPPPQGPPASSRPTCELDVSPDDGFSAARPWAPYREIGVDRARAELKSGFLSGFAANVIGSEFPKLAEKMHVRTAVLNWQSRMMLRIDCPAPPHLINSNAIDFGRTIG